MWSISADVDPSDFAFRASPFQLIAFMTENLDAGVRNINVEIGWETDVGVACDNYRSEWDRQYTQDVSFHS